MTSKSRDGTLTSRGLGPIHLRSGGDKTRMLSRMMVVAISILGAAGCCGTTKTAVRDYAVSVRTNTRPALVLIDRCKAGEQPACDIVKQNLQAIDASAARLEESSK